MKKKILIIAVIILVSFVIAAIAVACDNTCKHEYKFEAIDSNKHLRECLRCSDKIEESHNFVENLCDKCGYDKALYKIVSFDVNGGEENIEDLKFEIGKPMSSLPIPTREGYNFIVWKSADGTQFGLDSIMPDSNIELKAIWLNDYFKYTLSNDALTITGLENSAPADIIIPSDVTEIAHSAFSNSKSIKSVQISDSVVSIGYSAFANCKFMTSVRLPNNLTVIENGLFYDCWALKNLIIPDSVTKICSNAFADCSSLKNILIPASVTSIDAYAFSGRSTTIYCEAAQQPNDWHNRWSDNNTVIWNTKDYGVTDKGLNWVLYNDDLLKISGYTGRITDVTIPSEINGYKVTAIGASAFWQCYSLKSIVIPDSITNIGANAFNSCSSLTDLLIPASVTSIGNYAFSGFRALTIYCAAADKPAGWGSFDYTNMLILWDVKEYGVTDDGLKWVLGNNDEVTIIDYEGNSAQITLPSSINGYTVTNIGDSAFELSTITSIQIPSTVKNIGVRAFYSCSRLNDIKIPESVISLGEGAFYGVRSLTEIVIPKSVTSIGSSAFYGCYSLTIYCEAVSQPEDWAINWNSGNRPVVWGYEI